MRPMIPTSGVSRNSTRMKEPDLLTKSRPIVFPGANSHPNIFWDVHWKDCQLVSRGRQRSGVETRIGGLEPDQASVPPVQEKEGRSLKAFGGTTFGGRENSGMGKSSPFAFTNAFLSSVKPISSSVR
jgi:hypothetical protein